MKAMKNWMSAAMAAALLCGTSAGAQTAKPTIVLVHGDKNIPPQVLAFMAQRAHSKQTEVVRGASHALMVSKPKAVAQMIERAAAVSQVSS